MWTQKLSELCTLFFEKFWISYDEIQVEEDQKDIYRIILKTSDSHLIIGPHGKNLDHFTHILKLIISRKLWWFIHLHLEVNDYLQEKDARLYRFIESKVELVSKTWKEIILPQLSSYERKKVHSYIAEKGWRLYTQSIWEWDERRIHVCLKHEKMTIDLDGDDI